MKEPTEKQIDAEIKKLKALKPKLIPQTIFGGDNIAALDAVIETLEDRGDENYVYERWENEESDEADEHVAEWARGAALWISGDEPEAPSKGLPLKK